MLTLRYEMALAAAYAILVLGAGLGGLRALGFEANGVAVGLAPALGLALLTVGSTWCMALGMPPPVPGLVVLALAAVGFISGARPTWSAVVCHYRDSGWLVAALLVPVVVVTLAFNGVEEPLSTHDGAFHVQAIDALRTGHPLESWYPPGLDASFAALLQLAPWRDSAAGSFELALGLSILAPLTVFGLAMSVWSERTVAGVAALFASLTYLFGYFVHIWSGWPLQAAILMLIGAWIVGYEYIKPPALRLTVAGGLLAGAILATHGSELISAVLILPVVLLGNWRRIKVRRVPLDVAVVGLVALGCAAPYIPTLLRWAHGGGASAVGYAEAAAIDVAAQTAAGGEPLRVFALDALGIDLPLRVVLALIGGWWIFTRKSGRALVVVGVVFASVAAGFSFLSGVPVVRLVYALTYPWGLPYRLFQVDAVVIALTAAAGGIWAVRRMMVSRRAVRAIRVCVAAWLVVATFALTLFVSIPTGEVSSFTSDDAAAMEWMRANIPPSSVVVNDGYADAGIWIPYKAGLPIVLPRILPDAETKATRDSVVDNVARLDSVHDIACQLRVGYVYYGAKNTGWQTRRFPALEELKQSPWLERVYSSGAATVFRVRIDCPSNA